MKKQLLMLLVLLFLVAGCGAKDPGEVAVIFKKNGYTVYDTEFGWVINQSSEWWGGRNKFLL